MTVQQKICLSLYFVLLGVCISLFFFASSMTLEARGEVIPLARDGFKLVIGAIVGTLSAIIGVSANKGGQNER
jgi:hypothetical protein